MKKLTTLAALCLTATFFGCASTTDMSVSPAAVSECGVNCADACCPKSDDASYGAMHEKPSECSGKTSSDCSACPYASKAKDSI